MMALAESYGINDPSIAQLGDREGSVSLGPRAILSCITLGGLVNTLACQFGKVVGTITCTPLASMANAAQNLVMGDVRQRGGGTRHHRPQPWDRLLCPCCLVPGQGVRDSRCDQVNQCRGGAVEALRDVQER